jgi:hypothetical protein
MRRILATLFAISTIIVILFIMNQADNIGVPWEFNSIALVAIAIVIFGLIRTWLRP